MGSLRCWVGFIILCAPTVRALEVFINTNAPAKSSHASQLYDRGEWKETAEAIDGIWWVAQGMSKAPQGKSAEKSRDHFVESLKDKQWIIEAKEESASAMANGKHTVHELSDMKQAGIKHFSAMIWSEKHNKDSTIKASEAKEVREGFKAAGVGETKLIVNTRAFHRNHLLQELVKEDKVDGFSIEVPSHGVREGKILEAEVIPAIEFAVHQKKDVYLLLNAEHSKHLLEDVKDIYHRLVRGAGKAMDSPRVHIVISSYSAGPAQFTPERKGGEYAETVTGAALWLCHQADKQNLRERRGGR